MPKRFTDTEIWDKQWFMKLSPKEKCLVRFIFDKCDTAGVWTPNWALASAYIGETVNLMDLTNFSYRLEFLGEKIFVPDFIEFQYGELTDNCKPHRPIIQKLKKYGLYQRVLKGYQMGIGSDEEKEQEKETDKEKEEGVIGGEKKQWNTKPGGPEMKLELPPLKSRAVIEQFKITKYTDVDAKQVQSLWAIFKAQHFTGEKYYGTENEAFSHFINWSKSQKIEKINGSKNYGLTKPIPEVVTEGGFGKL